MLRLNPRFLNQANGILVSGVGSPIFPDLAQIYQHQPRIVVSALGTLQVIPGIHESNPELFEIYGRVALTGHITERKQVEDKTKQQLEELQRWYDLTLERETRSLELKREVNELLRRLQEPIRYPSVEV